MNLRSSRGMGNQKRIRSVILQQLLFLPQTITFTILLLLVLLVSYASAKQYQGYDLDPDAQIRIGVKKRIAAKDCLVKSQKGDVLSIHFVATLYKNGNIVDDTTQDSKPFQFKLGNEKVIHGLDIGLSNMCINEIRKLTIPSNLAYGDGDGNNGEELPDTIHPGATLVYEVELISITADANDYYGGDEQLNRDDDGYWEYYEQSHFTDL